MIGLNSREELVTTAFEIVGSEYPNGTYYKDRVGFVASPSPVQSSMVNIPRITRYRNFGNTIGAGFRKALASIDRTYYPPELVDRTYASVPAGINALALTIGMCADNYEDWCIAEGGRPDLNDLRALAQQIMTDIVLPLADTKSDVAVACEIFLGLQTEEGGGAITEAWKTVYTIGETASGLRIAIHPDARQEYEAYMSHVLQTPGRCLYFGQMTHVFDQLLNLATQLPHVIPEDIAVINKRLSSCEDSR